MAIRLPANNWQPRPYQLNLWNAFERGNKRMIEIAHRRWGKDELALNMAAVSSFQKPATYWHMLPEYAQARKAIWTAINPHTGIRRIDECFPTEVRSNTNEQEMFIRFINGATWQVVGSDNYKNLVGSPPYGIVFSEWSKANPGAWAYLGPILEENGGWALFITTPEGKNHAAAMYKMAVASDYWFAEIQTVEDTGFSKEKVENARKEYHALYGEDVGDSLINQEYYCSFDASLIGAYYGKEFAMIDREKRVGNVPYDPSLKVYTAWDLGMDDSTAIWFAQVVGQEVRLIDYYENSGFGLDHYAKVLDRKPYTYADHFLPHDAKVRELSNGKSRVETLEGLGIDVEVVPMQEIEDGINAVRILLAKSWFDAKCDKGIEALRQYQRKWDDDKRIFIARPFHNWTSHASDAFRYLALALPEKVGNFTPTRRKERSWMTA